MQREEPHEREVRAQGVVAHAEEERRGEREQDAAQEAMTG